MYFPKYWAWGEISGQEGRNKPWKMGAWGWSDVSVEEARQKGAERAERSRRALTDKHFKLEGYLDGRYGTGRPFFEDVVERLADGSVVSRNRPGCEVLNVGELGFVDVDRPEPPPAGLLSFLFKPKTVESVQKRVRDWVAVHPEDSFRVYQTAAGWRLILTNRSLDPCSEETQALFKALGADKEYVKLCRAQRSFRARLTPKPWRAGLDRTQVRPATTRTEKEEARFQAWLPVYAEVCANHAVCEFLETIGNGATLEDLRPLIAFHDKRTRATSGLPLA
jgi:hypothetical protein